MKDPEKNTACSCGQAHEGENEHGHGEHEHGHEHEHSHEHSHSHEHTHEHEHGHSHEHSHGENGEGEDRKKELTRIIISAVLFICVVILDRVIAPSFMQNRIVNTLCYLVPYLFVGREVILEAFRGIFHGELFGEEFLMVIASIGAFVVGENAEGSSVLILYAVGEFCQDLAADRSRRSIRDLMNLAPEYANVEAPDGTLKHVRPEELHIGDTVIILPGERIPVDGTVLSGSSMIDTSSLTGEPVPRRAAENSPVISGCINGEGRLTVRVDREYHDSTVAKVIELTETAADRKSPTESFITRFARIYTPAVVGLAFLLAVLPPLFTGDSFFPWLKRACTFLVISCPCALVISVPLAFFGGIGACGKNGILVKGSNYLEALSRVSVFVSDKTGTLTKGEFRVVKAVLPDGKAVEIQSGTAEPDASALLCLAAQAERSSTHPIAKSIREAAPAGSGKEALRSEDKYIPGQGMVQITEDGTEILAGSRKLLLERGIDCPETEETGTLVYVAENGKYKGILIVNDCLKPEAGEAIEQMRSEGVKRVYLLTGDTAEAAVPVKEALGLDGVLAQLLPQDKVEALEDMLDAVSGKEKLLYAGDGINDAPVLARADIGAAMGSLGSDAAIEAADIVIMDDDLRRIPLAMRIARKTVRLCRQNIVFALSVKALFLLLGVFGYTNLWMAVFADVGVALLCILNSMRVLRL